MASKKEKITALKKRTLCGFIICIIMLSLSLPMLALTKKTAVIAWQLFSASDNVNYAESQRSNLAPQGVQDYADQVYLDSANTRQKLYNSEDGYTRWFSYTMGKSSIRRFCSLIIWAIEFSLSVFFSVICYRYAKVTVKRLFKLYNLNRRGLR